ncbi:hypothetical protein DMB90_09380 [Raoultella planticola]|uniref:Uncharacterized protein n=1 Tax=Raoultella planticola TaxID=575 RepID=A0A5P6A9Z6_RAOPL|nr:hypothetical protein DMB90_09380 [Raoultella planticola]
MFSFNDLYSRFTLENALNENNVIKQAFFYFHLLLINRAVQEDTMTTQSQTVIDGHKSKGDRFCLLLFVTGWRSKEGKNVAGRGEM